MDAAWNALLAKMLRPARPRLVQCLARAEAHAKAERRAGELRARALADCRARIELARSSVFEAGDGVVDARMTALEREWLALARAERSVEPTADVDVTVALASDPDGVARAEACALRLASALSAWGLEVGATLTWRIAPEPTIDTRAEMLFERPLRALADAMASTYGAEALAERAQRLQCEVLGAASGSTTEALAADVALVARIDFFWRACAIDARCVPAGHPNAGRRFDELESPTTALVELWSAGYVLTAIDGGGMMLGAPPL